MFASRSFRRALFALAAFGVQMVPAIAQPTAEQQSALRNNCRSDFMSHCKGVQPGGAQALQCLQRNVAKLSAGCQSAVNALAPPSAPQSAAAPAAPSPASGTQTVAAPPSTSPAPAPHPGGLTPEQQSAMRQFCGADYMAKCGNVAPATAAALQCMKAHEAELSANCRGALTLIGAGGSSPPAQAAAPASAPAAALPAAAPAATPAAHTAKPHQTAPAAAAKPAAGAKPTAQQQAAIRQSCRNDFMSHCSGVQPGGVAALQCLQQHHGQLSANCRSAVAAIGGAAPAGAKPAAAATASAPAAAAAAPSQEQRNAIKAACQRDFMANCRGVTPGGQEALACLQRNSARLSPSCRSSVAAIAGGQPETAAATPAAATPTAAAPAPAVRGGPLRRAIERRREMRMEMQQ